MVQIEATTLVDIIGVDSAELVIDYLLQDLPYGKGVDMAIDTADYEVWRRIFDMMVVTHNAGATIRLEVFDDGGN